MQIRDIYAYYVVRTAITCEYEVPSLEKMRDRTRTHSPEISLYRGRREGRDPGLCLCRTLQTESRLGLERGDRSLEVIPRILGTDRSFSERKNEKDCLTLTLWQAL